MTDKFNEVQQAVLNNKKLVTVLVIVVFVIVFIFRGALCNPESGIYGLVREVCESFNDFTNTA